MRLNANIYDANKMTLHTFGVKSLNKTMSRTRISKKKTSENIMILVMKLAIAGCVGINIVMLVTTSTCNIKLKVFMANDRRVEGAPTTAFFT
jgi:hypothetical protein